MLKRNNGKRGFHESKKVSKVQDIKHEIWNRKIICKRARPVFISPGGYLRAFNTKKMQYRVVSKKICP